MTLQPDRRGQLRSARRRTPPAATSSRLGIIAICAVAGLLATGLGTLDQPQDTSTTAVTQNQASPLPLTSPPPPPPHLPPPTDPYEDWTGDPSGRDTSHSPSGELGRQRPQPRTSSSRSAQLPQGEDWAGTGRSGSPSAAPSTGVNQAPSGGQKAGTDAMEQSFTSTNGLTSSYHMFGAGVPTPSGLLLQFHGDGAHEFKKPTSSYSLGGEEGIVAQAKAKGYMTVAVLTPDHDSKDVTWWEEGEENAVFVKDLLAMLKSTYAIDTNRTWLVGYSGGSQFITKFYLPKFSDTISGGGAIMFGGGGAPSSNSALSSALKSNFIMHWHTGALDDGRDTTDGYDARSDAEEGKVWFDSQGFTTSHTWPAHTAHDLSGKFGEVVGEVLK